MIRLSLWWKLMWWWILNLTATTSIQDTLLSLYFEALWLITLMFSQDLHYSLTYTFRAFRRCFCPKRLKVIHTYIHWWWQLPCKVLTSTSGAVWSSVSCPKTLRHADQGNWTGDLLITRSRLYPWSKAATLLLTICLFSLHSLCLTQTYTVGILFSCSFAGKRINFFGLFEEV